MTASREPVPRCASPMSRRCWCRPGPPTERTRPGPPRGLRVDCPPVDRRPAMRGAAICFGIVGRRDRHTMAIAGARFTHVQAEDRSVRCEVLAARAWRLGRVGEPELGLDTGVPPRAREVEAWLLSAFEDAAIGTALIDLDPAAGARVLRVNP